MGLLDTKKTMIFNMGTAKILMIYPEKKTEGKRFFPLGFYIASTIMNNNGFDVLCIDLSFYEDYKVAITDKIKFFNPNIIGFSICGAANYKYALDIINEMKLNQTYPLVFGGQHMHPLTDKENIYYKSFVGDLESVGHFFDKKISCSHMSSVDYDLVPYKEMYYPSVEISRGCWNHCRFCNSSNNYLVKDCESIKKDLLELSSIYPKGTILTLAGSNHHFGKWKAGGLIEILLDYSSHFRFNFNLGVESGWENIWSYIIRLNPWNIFVGLESCDTATLLRMQKSKTPHTYIKKATDLLGRCKTDGVYLFASYIYGYPGHTVNDIDQLDKFLLNHSCSNIVQMGFPCEAYPGTALLIHRKYYEQLGVKYNEVYPGENIEFYRLDISSELTHEYLLERAKKIHKYINTNDMYILNRCKGKL